MIAAFLIVLIAQPVLAEITSADLNMARSLDQYEEAPNEPPFNTAREAEATLDDERLLTDEYPESKPFVPRWKQQKRRLPEESRVKQLNKEKGLFRITKKNEYQYQVKRSPQHNAFSFRFGSLTLSNLYNSAAGYSYEDIYGGGSAITLFGDWEWQFFKSAGKLALKVGSGLSYAQGNGRWEQGSPNDTPDKQPLEKYSFYILPNNVAITYRADYFHNQIIVPYGEGGIDYFTFGELRDDGDFKYGGALAWHIAGGLALLLDWINPQTMIVLDREEGINHMYFVAEYRIITGLNKKFDFSDNVINGGFLIEY